MKRKIVFLLCYLRMEKLACKISPSYAVVWKANQFVKGIKKELAEAFLRGDNNAE